MPELPEVEVLRASLEPHLRDRRIIGVRVWNAALRETVNKTKLERLAVGRRISTVQRKAKYLVVGLHTGDSIVVHLGMSGRLTLAEAGQERETHEHVAFFLDDGRKLRFRDPRRFGLVLALTQAEMETDRRLSGLGVEPLGGEFCGDRLRLLAKGRRGPVKSFLMNARLVAGVGNIYASEALHLAGIHPARSVARISQERWNRLADKVKLTLQRAIEEGGTTLNDFADGEGREGYFQVSLAVYGREGRPCLRCGKAIRRSVQVGRSTFYCPGCQH